MECGFLVVIKTNGNCASDRQPGISELNSSSADAELVQLLVGSTCDQRRVVAGLMVSVKGYFPSVLVVSEWVTPCQHKYTHIDVLLRCVWNVQPAWSRLLLLHPHRRATHKPHSNNYIQSVESRVVWREQHMPVMAAYSIEGSVTSGGNCRRGLILFQSNFITSHMCCSSICQCLAQDHHQEHTGRYFTVPGDDRQGHCPPLGI